MPGSSGKFARPKRGTPPSAEVMFQTAVRWLISSIATDRISRRQRADGRGLGRAQALLDAGLEAERRVQIRAHQVVLEFRGFVERVHDALAGCLAQVRRGRRWQHREDHTSRIAPAVVQYTSRW